jgi:3'(2'), 5'-bisphosphate nucleotidase
VKFGRVAEGSAPLYPCFHRTSEWDTAAGQVLVEEAGGRMMAMDGAEIRYNKPDLENPPFIAFAPGFVLKK